MTDAVYVTPNNAAQIKAVAAANAPPAAPKQGIQVNSNVGKTASITFKDGAVASSGTTTLQKSTSGAAISSDLAGKPVTGRSSFGRPLVASELNDKSEIDVGGGLTTSLAAARASGLITQDQHGNWVHAGATKPSNFKDASTGRSPAEAQPHQQEQQDQQNEPKQDDASQVEHIDALDERSEALMKDVVSNVPAQEAQSYANELIETGSLSPQSLAKFSQRFNISHEQAADTAAHVFQAFHAQASKAVGYHAEDLWVWSRTNAPNELKAAIQEHVNKGSYDGYQKLSQQYLETFDKHSPEVVLRSDASQQYKPQRESDNTISIELPGYGRVSWRQAVRQGFIKVGFNSPPQRR